MLGEPLIFLEEIDSTNNELKRRANSGAAEGLALLANHQTHGRGRLGRSFQSLAGQGLYLSVLLRPKVTLAVASQFTAWAAVAVCRALEQEIGLSAVIKWPNDILVEGKKLCGILTEAAGSAVILGLGLNLTQTANHFGPDLADRAISLAQLGYCAQAQPLARAILRELDTLYARFPEGAESCRAEFKSRCVTLGRDVVLMREGGSVPARAVDVTPDFGLVVEVNGRRETVTCGEVSVRGLLGYS